MQFSQLAIYESDRIFNFPLKTSSMTFCRSKKMQLLLWKSESFVEILRESF